MLIFKFLHIAAMFGAVTLVFGSSLYLDLVGRARDVETYRRLDAIIQRTDLVAFGLFLSGLGFGLLTALSGGIDLLASWLVLAYVIVAALFVEAFVFTVPSYNRVREAANLPDREAAAEEVKRLLGSPRHLIALAAGSTLWLATIFVMVIKPDLF